MNRDEALFRYTCRLGDNALILGQRMVELVAGMADLEEELANANFALDYIGQARHFYSYAAELEGKGRSEDDFAFLRDEREFENLLLLEQETRHFGDSIAKLVMFDIFYLAQLGALLECGDQRLAEIAARGEKEIRYHLRHNSQWLVRLGDGTEESSARVQESIDDLWRYTGEIFAADDVDQAFSEEFGGPDLSAIRERWDGEIAALLKEATLTRPEDGWMALGGKQGRHTEQMGYLLAEMQHLPRSHPGATW